MKTKISVHQADHKKRFARARRLQARGQFDQAITAYEADILQVVRTDASTLTPSVETELYEAVAQTLQLLRWSRDYGRALSLLERLSSAAPSTAQAFDLDMAMLTIANGDVEAGLEKLRRMIDDDPDNIYLRGALGAELIGIGRYNEAEAKLRAAAALETAHASDRAQIYGLLFDLYHRKPDVDRAEEAWIAGCELDPALSERRLDVIRMFIYWRHFGRAMDYIRRESNTARQYFYAGLCEFSTGRPPNVVKPWRLLADRRVEAVRDCPDEYAEACLYLNEPRKALDVLRPLVDAGDVAIWRVLLLGLAYALTVDLSSAKHFLDISLRLADSARPRESRRGTGSQIIHSGTARETYGKIITATDLRAELDVFFIPLPAVGG